TAPAIVTPTDTGLDAIMSVGLGVDHSCAANTTGQLFCWGDDDATQLGDGQYSRRSSPAPVATPSGVTYIAGGDDTSYAVAGGAVYAWGLASDGEIGDGAS